MGSVAFDALVAREEPASLDSRLALRASEAAQALGISERHLRQLLPELPHVHLGTTVVIPVADLREWLSRRSQTERKQEKDEARSIARSLLEPGT